LYADNPRTVSRLLYANRTKCALLQLSHPPRPNGFPSTVSYQESGSSRA